MSLDATEQARPALSALACPLTSEEISSKINGWGGPREHSGGPRANSGGRREGAGRPLGSKSARPDPDPEPLAPAWSAPRWCVYQTHPQAEGHATEELTRAGYDAYLPLIAIRRRDAVVPSMWHKVRVPMFPGYGFVRLGPTDPWAPIHYLPGVKGLLLTTSGHPGPVPDGFVEALKGGDAERCDLTGPAFPKLAPGTVVTIDDGPFMSFPGTVVECDGETTLVDVAIFARLTAVRLPRGSLIVVAEPARALR
jgi:transcription antitermination factor NusG